MWSSSKYKNHLDPLIVSHGWNKKNNSTNQKGALGNSRFIDMFEFAVNMGADKNPYTPQLRELGSKFVDA